MLKGREDGSVSPCVVWLQKQQLKTGLEKRFAVDMALCAISSDTRQSETVEPHPAVLSADSAQSASVATHHARRADGILKDWRAP